MFGLKEEIRRGKCGPQCESWIAPNGGKPQVFGEGEHQVVVIPSGLCRASFSENGQVFNYSLPATEGEDCHAIDGEGNYLNPSE